MKDWVILEIAETTLFQMLFFILSVHEYMIEKSPRNKKKNIANVWPYNASTPYT